MKQIFWVVLVLLAVGCSSKQLIQDPATLARVEQRLAERAEWLPVLPEGLPADQRQGLEFLYAYLPVGDVGEYGVDFFLSNVQASLVAREEMPWGVQVPEREFLHFVLPVRINNEALDSSRTVFYAELKDRVKGLPMKDAVLEVNHWCHEKVNYSPTDGRTMSPLALLANATGRCGEESTFVVAALRAVGIPARQVYVPRWAHTDDNHAWVEAWAVDETGAGRWYYMGACEPEPVLNTGWFDAPAKRSLLMSTKVFGDYVDSTAQVLSRADGFTEISVTENYAPVGPGRVVVRDELGAVVEGAEVLFSIYNYATYYPALRSLTDAQGEASIRAGLGSLVVTATKGGRYAGGVLDLRQDQPLELMLGALPDTVVEWDLVPPTELPVENKVSEEARAQNNARFAAEDSIRTAYIATFADRKFSDGLAGELGVDTARLWKVFERTRGNHRQVQMFLLNTPRAQTSLALDLLEVVSTKDLRDTPCDVLLDHLNQSVRFAQRAHFKQYILNPRIDNELLTAYRAAFDQGDTAIDARAVIGGLWATAIVDSLNPARLHISPAGVLRVKMGDRASVERMMIAALRSNGIAARREPLSGRAEYFADGKWNYFAIDDQTDVREVPGKGTLVVEIMANNVAPDPKLDSHFTMAKWNGSRYVPVKFDQLGVDWGGAATARSIYAQPMPLEAGRYMITTGTRLASGKVLARNTPVTIKADSTTKAKLTMRESVEELNVIGAIDAEAKYLPVGATDLVSLLSTTGRGTFLVAMIDAKKEPTTHFMRALARHKADLEKWGRPIVLILRDAEQLKSLNLADFPPLPSTVQFGSDVNGAMSNMIGKMCAISDMSRLPVVVVGDSFGRVVYISTGYNTSVGDHMVTIIDLLDQEKK